MKKTLGSVIISNFLNSGLGFLLNVFLARILTLEEYGKISLVFSFVLILFSAFEFNFGNSLVIFFNRRKKEFTLNKNNLIFFVNNIFAKYILFGLIFIIICSILIQYFFKLTNQELLVIVINFYLFLFYRYIITIHQAIANWKLFNILNVLNNIIKSLAVFVFIYLITIASTKYQNILIAFIFYPFLLLSIGFFSSKKWLSTKFKGLDKKDFIEFKKILIPLGISNIFMLISMRADNLIIEKMLGSEALGIYAAANIMALMFPLITSALRNVFLQKGSGQGKEFLGYIIKNQKKYFPYVVLILFVFIISSKYLFLIFYGEKYLESASIFRVLIFAYIGGVLFTPIESYFYGKYPKMIRNLKFFQMIIILFCIILLIKFFGLLGVAIAILISRVFGWLFLIFMVKKEAYK